MAAFTTVPHCARAVNTHLKTRSLTPEVYPPMQDERDGGGEQNQEITARIYPSVAGLAQPILQVGQFEPQEIKMLSITVHNSPSRDS